MKITKLLFLLGLLLCVNSYAGDTKKVKFGSGIMAVEFPAYINMTSVTESGLVVLIDDEGTYKLELSRIDVGSDMPDGFGMYAVAKMAEKRGREVKKLGDRVLLQEPPVLGEEGKVEVLTTHLSIGLSKSIITMTLTTPPNDVVPPSMAKRVTEVVNSAITTVAEL
jgi:hypothetical protein|tara:strand:- start:1442 stop:1939 length:498 start_codon:yes stop_codon:yes gene_type:complete